MKRRIYHGSSKIIKSPTYGLGKPYNDYGRGFYCTEIADMAKEWSVSRNRNGFLNIYEFDDRGLEIMNLSDAKYCILNWLAILLENRSFDVISPLAVEAKKYILENFRTDYKRYDVIIGYRADDSYFSFASDFLNGGISYRQLGNAMHLGKMGLQFVIKSKIAFDRIEFVGNEMATADIWFPKKKSRDSAARNEYFDSEKNKRRKDDIFITRIIDEEMTADELRL